jgi:hypothetical protein
VLAVGWYPHTGGRALALAAMVGVVACGPAGGTSTEVPAVTSEEDPEAEPSAPAEDDDGDAGDGEPEVRVVLGAPFRVPSPTELSLTGVELADRIVAACEAAQPDGEPRPAGPCVEVAVESRPDPDREPGWWIETIPTGGAEVPHGETVTIVVADDSSPTGGVDPAGEPSGGPDPAEEEGGGDGA